MTLVFGRLTNILLLLLLGPILHPEDFLRSVRVSFRSLKAENGATYWWTVVTWRAETSGQSASSVPEEATYSTPYCACTTSWKPEDADDDVIIW